MTAPNQQQGSGQHTSSPTQQPAQTGNPGNQQGTDQGQQTGQQVTPLPGSPPNPWLGLLDVAPQPGQGQPQQGQQFTAQPGQVQGAQGWPQQQMVDLIGRAVQSAVDRRVNQMTNPQWQQAHGQPQPPTVVPTPPPFQQGTNPAPAGYNFTVPPWPSEADQREARMAAREYLGDRITFGSEAERAMAVDLTSALIPTQLLMGMTPNQAALNVAQTVADRVGSLRRTYEDQAVRALRSRGLLVETPQGPPAMAGSVGLPQGGLPVGTAQQHNAAAKAAKLAVWAQEENAQRGWNTQTATA